MAASTSPSEPNPARNSIEVRDRLVEALRLDLVGPWSGHPLETEQIPNYTRHVRPSNWYLTGFIVPPDTVASEAASSEMSDDLDETPDRAGTAEESSDEGRPTRRGFFQLSGICQAEALADIGKIRGVVTEDRIGRLVTARLLPGAPGPA